MGGHGLKSTVALLDGQYYSTDGRPEGMRGGAMSLKAGQELAIDLRPRKFAERYGEFVKQAAQLSFEAGAHFQIEMTS